MTVVRGITIAFVLLSLPIAAVAEQHADPEQLKAAVAANSLTGEGKQPFHIKINFTMLDMTGKEGESGTVEEWWAAPGVERIVVASPSLNYTIPGDGATADVSVGREKYFVEKLLEQAVHPIPDIAQAPFPFNIVNRTFGNIQLSCYASRDATIGINYCVDPKSNILRGEFESNGFAVSRNSLGIYQATNVAMDISISLQGKEAISGKVVALQSFNPATSTLVLSKAPSPSVPTVGAKVTQGKITYRTQPVFPFMAKAAHVGGTVVLLGRITKQGNVADLLPLASPSPMLTNAAMDAVKQWTYQPYLLNGEPTEIETVISVNFNIASQ